MECSPQEELGILPSEYSRKVRKPQKECQRAYLCIRWWQDDQMTAIFQNWDSDWGMVYNTLVKIIESEFQLLIY